METSSKDAQGAGLGGDLPSVWESLPDIKTPRERHGVGILGNRVLAKSTDPSIRMPHLSVSNAADDRGRPVDILGAKLSGLRSTMLGKIEERTKAPSMPPMPDTSVLGGRGDGEERTFITGLSTTSFHGESELQAEPSSDETGMLLEPRPPDKPKNSRRVAKPGPPHGSPERALRSRAGKAGSMRGRPSTVGLSGPYPSPPLIPPFTPGGESWMMRGGLATPGDVLSQPYASFPIKMFHKPGVVPQNSVGVQAAPLPWTRYYFPEEKNSQNCFFKHFDVMDLDPLPHDFPDGEMAEPLPSHLQEEWRRLYYSDGLAERPGDGHNEKWPNVNLHPRSSVFLADVGKDINHKDAIQASTPGFSFERRNSKNIRREERVDVRSERDRGARMELVDFVRVVQRLQPRTLDDLRPLQALRGGLLTYLADLIEDSDKQAYDKWKVRERALHKVFDEQLEFFKQEAESLLEQELENTEKKMRLMQLGMNLKLAIRSQWKEKAEEQTVNLIYKMETLEKSDKTLRDRLHETETKLKDLQTQIHDKDEEMLRLNHKLQSTIASNEEYTRQFQAASSTTEVSAERILMLETELADAKKKAKYAGFADKYYEELQEALASLDTLRKAYRKRSQEAERRYQAAMQESRQKFKELTRAAVGAVVLATSNQHAGDVLLQAMKKYSEEQKTSSLSEDERYQNSMMVWDLEAELALGKKLSSHGTMDRSPSGNARIGRKSQDGVVSRSNSRSRLGLEDENISLGQAARTGNIINLKSKLKNMASQLNHTMMELRGKSTEVDELQAMLSQMQKQMRDVSEALVDQVKVEEGILAERQRLKKSVAEEEGEDLKDAADRLLAMRAHAERLTSLKSPVVGKYMDALKVCADLAESASSPPPAKEPGLDKRVSFAISEASSVIETGPSHKPPQPDKWGKYARIAEVDEELDGAPSLLQELEAARQIAQHLQRENTVVHQALDLVQEYLDEKLSADSTKEVSAACIWAKSACNSVSEPTSALHFLTQVQEASSGAMSVYDMTVTRVKGLRDEMEAMMDKMGFFLDRTGETASQVLTGCCTETLTKLRDRLQDYTDPIDDARTDRHPRSSQRRSRRLSGKGGRSMELIWMLDERVLQDAMDLVVVLEEEIEELKEHCQPSISENDPTADQRPKTPLPAQVQEDLKSMSEVLADMMGCIGKEQQGKGEVEERLGKVLEDIPRLTEEVAVVVKAGGQQQESIDLNLLALAQVRWWSRGQQLFLALSELRGLEKQEQLQDMDDAPLILKLQKELKESQEDKVATQTMVRKLQDELAAAQQNTLQTQQGGKTQFTPSKVIQGAKPRTRRRSIIQSPGLNTQQFMTANAALYGEDPEPSPSSSLNFNRVVHDSAGLLRNGSVTAADGNIFARKGSLVNTSLEKENSRGFVVPASPGTPLARNITQEFNTPSTSGMASNISPALRWQLAIQKVQNLLGTNLRESRLLRGLKYIEMLARNAAEGDAGAAALLQAQNRIAAIAVGAIDNNDDGPLPGGLDLGDSKQAVKRLSAMLLGGDGSDSQDSKQPPDTGSVYDQYPSASSGGPDAERKTTEKTQEELLREKTQEIDKMQSIIMALQKELATQAVTQAAGAAGSRGPQMSLDMLAPALADARQKREDIKQRHASFSEYLEDPADEEDYLDWLFSPSTLTLVQDENDVQQLIQAALSFMRDEHNCHVYTSKVVTNDPGVPCVTYNDKAVRVVVTTSGCPLAMAGEELSRDPKSSQYRALNQRKRQVYQDKQSGRSMVVLPIVLNLEDEAVPPSWGTLTFTQEPSKPDPQLTADAETVVKGVALAICNFLGKSQPAKAKDVGLGSSQQAGREMDADRVKHLQKQKMLVEEMFSKNEKLKSMALELKRYRSVPVAVAGVSAAVLVLLGDERMLDMVRDGLPKGSMAVQNIWIHAQKGFSGIKKGMKSNASQEDVFDKIKEFTFDNLDPEYLECARAILDTVSEEQVQKASRVIVVLREWAEAVVGIAGLTLLSLNSSAPELKLDLP